TLRVNGLPSDWTAMYSPSATVSVGSYVSGVALVTIIPPVNTPTTTANLSITATPADTSVPPVTSGTLTVNVIAQKQIVVHTTPEGLKVTGPDNQEYFTPFTYFPQNNNPVQITAHDQPSQTDPNRTKYVFTGWADDPNAPAIRQFSGGGTIIVT